MNFLTGSQLVASFPQAEWRGAFGLTKTAYEFAYRDLKMR